MSLRKFASVDAMPAAQVLAPLCADNLKQAFELCRLVLALAGARPSTAGVRKFRSFDELRAQSCAGPAR